MYLERILGARPRAAELLEPGRDLAAALKLAECEARLDRAHRHDDFDHLQENLEDLMYFDWIEDRAKRAAARRIMRLEHVSKRYVNHEKKLAGRYLREAQSRRDRVLEHHLSHS